MENNGRRLGVRKGSWTKEEDDLLKKCIEKYGEGKWHHVPLRAGLNRCRKSCRLRWLNYLRPNIKRGYFTRDEVDLIRRLHKLLGNRWSLIAGRLPGRTANDIKNFWNTHIEKNIKSAAAAGGGETKNCRRATKSITESNIIRPRPRTFSKLQVPAAGGCPSITHHQPSKTNSENPNDGKLQPSLSQDPCAWTDECVRWWSNLLEISTHQNRDGTPFWFSSELDPQIKEPILPDADQDGFTNSLSMDHVNVW